MIGGEPGRRPSHRGTLVAAVVAAASLAAFPPASAGSAEPGRYSLAGGCYSLVAVTNDQPIASASQLRLQATDLGSYLLYGPARDFVAASGADVTRDEEPSPAADWTVEETGDGSFALSPGSAPDQVLVAHGGDLAMAARDGAGEESHFRFTTADGCADYPEAELNVTGAPAQGETPYGEVRGLLDGHSHWMNFEYIGGNFHCGRPWHRYGIPYALPDCQEVEGPKGMAAPIQNFLNFGSPVAPHDTTGWPKLTEWRRDNVTYEGTYYRWIERAYMAGLRLTVMPVNENRELCNLMANRRNACDEANTTRLELDDMYELQDYADAQAGGPGKGFFQIVKSPFEARRVINDGRMAVVLEMEVSEPFNCRGAAPDSCSREIIDQGLEDLYQRGVRSSLLLNKFDNPLTGVRFDSGPVGTVINAGNRDSYGSFWDAKTCEGPEHDNEIFQAEPQAGSFLADLQEQLGVPGGTTPTYPPAPHCNTRGLTDLGKYMVRRMMDMGMVVNPDHMSQEGVDDTLTLAEARDYSGVISPHGWMDPRNWPRIWQLGGMAFPGAGSAQGFVDVWKTYRPQATPQYFGWGYGADLGGLATQGAPSSPDAVTYPFRSIDGSTTVDRQRTGDRTFDYDQEGVAHYGLYAEWYEDVAITGGQAIADDMLHGAEAYLQMWERSVGVPASECKSEHARFKPAGLGRIRLGLGDRQLLESAGQPLERTQAWNWCVAGKRDQGAAQTAVLTDDGTVALVASSARGQGIGGIASGDSGRLLRGEADRLGGGVWVRPFGGSTAVYLVRDRVVKAAAVATPTDEATLRSYLDLLPPDGVTPRPDHVITQTSSKVDPAKAAPVTAQDGSPQFSFFCGL